MSERTPKSYDPISELDRRMDIERAIDRLPKREKRAIEERYLDGRVKSFEEAGRELGIGGQAVRVRENIALKKLRLLKTARNILRDYR